MAYPFPTPGDDEMQSKLGIEPPAYDPERLEAAAHSWVVWNAAPAGPGLFIRLLAICEGSVAEATVLWDAVRAHQTQGLKRYLERSARHYLQRYGQTMLSERSCRRAIHDLCEAGYLVPWPQAKSSGQRFRLDWVLLADRLQALVGVALPGLEGGPSESVQGDRAERVA